MGAAYIGDRCANCGAPEDWEAERDRLVKYAAQADDATAAAYRQLDASRWETRQAMAERDQAVAENHARFHEIERLREYYAEAQAGWDKVSDENDRLREALRLWRQFWGAMSADAIGALTPYAKRCFQEAAKSTVEARQALEGTSDE